MTKLDRSEIFFSAHRHARQMIRWSGFRRGYRKAFSIALREAWAAEKEALAEAAYQASLPPIPPEIEERARELRDMAWGCRIDGPGNEMFCALHAQARELVDAARGF